MGGRGTGSTLELHCHSINGLFMTIGCSTRRGFPGVRLKYRVRKCVVRLVALSNKSTTVHLLVGIVRDKDSCRSVAP